MNQEGIRKAVAQYPIAFAAAGGVIAGAASWAQDFSPLVSICVSVVCMPLFYLIYRPSAEMKESLGSGSTVNRREVIGAVAALAFWLAWALFLASVTR